MTIFVTQTASLERKVFVLIEIDQFLEQTPDWDVFFFFLYFGPLTCLKNSAYLKKRVHLDWNKTFSVKNGFLSDKNDNFQILLYHFNSKMAVFDIKMTIFPIISTVLRQRLTHFVCPQNLKNVSIFGVPMFDCIFDLKLTIFEIWKFHKMCQSLVCQSLAKDCTWKEYVFGCMSHPAYVMSQMIRAHLIWIFDSTNLP